MFPAVSCAIPGAKSPQQAKDNAGASALPALDGRLMDAVQVVYDDLIRPHVHQSW
jgi:hypothetical protein